MRSHVIVQIFLGYHASKFCSYKYIFSFKFQLNNDLADSHFYSQELGDDFESCIVGSFKKVIIGFLFLLFFLKFTKTKHGINFGYGLKLLIIGEQVIY